MTGFEYVAWASRQTCGSAAAKLVLLILASWADGDGYCYPGQASIAERAEMTERSVRSHLVRLEERGLIRREARMRADGRGRSSDGYWLLADDQAENLAGRSRPTGKIRREVRRPTGKTRPDQPENISGELTSRTNQVKTSLADADASAQKKPRDERRDPLFEAVAEACGCDWRQLTSSARGALNAATKQIRDVGGTPDEVHRRARAYRRRFDAVLTPTALAKWWPSLGASTNGANGRGGGDGDPSQWTTYNPLGS